MNRKNKKRAFVTSIIMLIISAIVLTSSTFAWFVMGDKAEIEQMDLKLYSTDGGFEISANATDVSWRNYLTLGNIFDNMEETAPEGHEDLVNPALDAYSGNRNMLPELLIPASSSFNSFGDYGYPDIYRATIHPDGSAQVSKVTEVVGTDKDGVNKAGIVAFDVFFKSPTAQTIDFGQTEIKKIDSKADPKGTDDPTTTIRYALVPMGTSPVGTAAGTIQQLQGASAAKVTIAEAESLKRSIDGASKGGHGEGHITTVPLNSTSPTTAYLKDQIINDGTAAPQGKVYWSDDEKKTFDLDAGITKVRFYIWAEGNDVDCRESIASSDLSIAFKFAVAE